MLCVNVSSLSRPGRAFRLQRADGASFVEEGGNFPTKLVGVETMNGYDEDDEGVMSSDKLLPMW